MPTNRSYTTRKMTGPTDGLPEEIFQAFTSGFGHLISLDHGWRKSQTEAELSAAWKKYRAKILKRDMAENRTRNRPGRRPEEYLRELEEKHPRRVIGREKWMGPQCGPEPRQWQNDPVYESDEQYLARLGLLEPWEKELLAKQAAEPAGDEDEPDEAEMVEQLCDALEQFENKEKELEQ